MNYQYRYGSTTTVAIRTLYHDGGWTRYYRGLIAALIQGPSRALATLPRTRASSRSSSRTRS